MNLKVVRGGAAGAVGVVAMSFMSFMTFNLMHPASTLESAGGVPAYGNQPTAWDEASNPDEDYPEHR